MASGKRRRLRRFVWREMGGGVGGKGGVVTLLPSLTRRVRASRHWRDGARAVGTQRNDELHTFTSSRRLVPAASSASETADGVTRPKAAAGLKKKRKTCLGELSTLWYSTDFESTSFQWKTIDFSPIFCPNC